MAPKSTEAYGYHTFGTRFEWFWMYWNSNWKTSSLSLCCIAPPGMEYPPPLGDEGFSSPITQAAKGRTLFLCFTLYMSLPLFFWRGHCPSRPTAQPFFGDSLCNSPGKKCVVLTVQMIRLFAQLRPGGSETHLQRIWLDLWRPKWMSCRPIIVNRGNCDPKNARQISTHQKNFDSIHHIFGKKCACKHLIVGVQANMSRNTPTHIERYMIKLTQACDEEKNGIAETESCHTHTHTHTRTGTVWHSRGQQR